MLSESDHAAWERWCSEWNEVDFNAYSDFRVWQSAKRPSEQEDALKRVLRQAETAADIKMVRKVYYHAPYGSSVKAQALEMCLRHARDTNDSWLARDVYQHSGDTGGGEKAMSVYQDITGNRLAA